MTLGSAWTVVCRLAPAYQPSWPGLDPAIQYRLLWLGPRVGIVPMQGGTVYIVSSKRDGSTRLAYCESYDDIRNALQREENLKHRPLVLKLVLIHEANPEREDLYERLNVQDLHLPRK